MISGMDEEHSRATEAEDASLSSAAVDVAAEGGNAGDTTTSSTSSRDRDASGLAHALLGWIKKMDESSEEEGILSKVVADVDDLCDGVAFFDVLATV